MRFVVQRSLAASVTVDGEIIGSIDRGLVVLIGVSESDDRKAADRLIRKLLGLRIFEDNNGKTNISLKDAGGSLLLVSQFTLYADCRKGNRPSFTRAGSPDKARELYEYITDRCRSELDKWNEEAGMAAETGDLNGFMYGAGTVGTGVDVDSDTDPTTGTEHLHASRYRVATGRFGADMKVSLVNDGPFTVILDSAEL